MFVHAPGVLCTTQPTIVASSNSDVCRVVSQRSLSYTCYNQDLALTWTSSVWSGSFSVSAFDKGSVLVPALNVTGVTLMDTHKSLLTCLVSTLTFTGHLSALTQLNGVMLNCSNEANHDQDSVFIIVPSKKCIKISVDRVPGVLFNVPRPSACMHINLFYSSPRTSCIDEYYIIFSMRPE